MGDLGAISVRSRQDAWPMSHSRYPTGRAVDEISRLSKNRARVDLPELRGPQSRTTAPPSPPPFTSSATSSHALGNSAPRVHVAASGGGSTPRPSCSCITRWSSLYQLGTAPPMAACPSVEEQPGRPSPTPARTLLLPILRARPSSASFISPSSQIALTSWSSTCPPSPPASSSSEQPPSKSSAAASSSSTASSSPSSPPSCPSIAAAALPDAAFAATLLWAMPGDLPRRPPPASIVRERGNRWASTGRRSSSSASLETPATVCSTRSAPPAGECSVCHSSLGCSGWPRTHMAPCRTCTSTLPTNGTASNGDSVTASAWSSAMRVTCPREFGEFRSRRLPRKTGAP